MEGRGGVGTARCARCDPFFSSLPHAACERLLEVQSAHASSPSSATRAYVLMCGTCSGAGSGLGSGQGPEGG